MLKIGSRGSDLALFQARQVQREIREKLGLPSELVIIKTLGDQKLEVALDELEGKGFFTKEIEDALLNGEIDAAVHSLKDLPTRQPPGLEIAALLKRDDPGDLLLVRPEAFEPEEEVPVRRGARVGSSSLRRQAQLKALRPDIQLEDLRGNVPTRVQKLREGKYDAILIAKAGVDRLQLDLHGFEVKVFDPRMLVPAPGQGIVCVETRAGSTETELLKALNDPASRRSAAAERGLLALLEGGCRLPLGAYAEAGKTVKLRAVLGDEKLSGTLFRVEMEADTAEEAAQKAFQLLSERRNNGNGKKLLVVTRAAGRSYNLVERLQAQKVEVLFFPTFAIVPQVNAGVWNRLAQDMQKFGWIFFTSQAAVEQFFARCRQTFELPTAFAQAKFAVIGQATQKALEKCGFSAALIPPRATSEALAEEFLKLEIPPEVPLLFPAAEKTRGVLEKGLETRGYKLTRLVLYSLQPVPPEHFRRLDGRKIDYLLFTSCEAVRCFLDVKALSPETKVISIGPITSAAIRKLGLSVYRELPEAKLEAVTEIL